MMKHNRTLLVLLTLFWFGFSMNHLIAQQSDVPKLADVTSMKTISSPDSTVFANFLNRGCQDSTYFVRRVENWKGGVEYRKDLKTYVISYGIPNTWDSQYTGIICNWPQAEKWLGRSVTFSGRYYRAPGVTIRYGGETIYYLYITAIQ